MKRSNILFGLIVGILGLVLAIGVQTFARPCSHPDGSAAMCAPVRTWLTVEGGLIAVLAGISLLRPNPVTPGLSAAGGLIIALTPGTFVSLCKNDTMACQQVTRPTALVLGIVILLSSVSWMAVTLAAKKREARS